MAAAETVRLKGIIAKALRKAKRWYFVYILSQLVILGFAVLSIFCQIDQRLSAVAAFVAVLGTECLRWRSDFWKSQGEFAKRRWELIAGLAVSVSDGWVADWLAAKPGNFLADVSEDELKGSEFDSLAVPGPRRLLENTEESAWWSKHESRFVAWYLGLIRVVVLAGAFLALTITISGLGTAVGASKSTITQNVGAMICAVLAFIFSINLVRLLVSCISFFHSAKSILGRCRALLDSGNVDERSALLLLFDYQTSRDAAPLLPTLVWKVHGQHLRREWHRFRSRS
jgi:hypothetical protein